tara:strand:+ start:610 stop:951 length:342 start_codon:yes stop_codon:yes gene_type:complete
MIKLKNLISESTWDRKFGEPLPTISDVMEKHNCDCGGSCCGITEDVKHITRAKKIAQAMQKDESRIRLHMWEIVEQMSKDEVNKYLGDMLKYSYKKNVTQFMRDMMKYVRKMK